jgi:hypothetical protein
MDCFGSNRYLYSSQNERVLQSEGRRSQDLRQEVRRERIARPWEKAQPGASVTFFRAGTPPGQSGT